MNYRGKILYMSPTGEGGRRNEYVCTSHYGDHIEIVSTTKGNEAMVFPPIPLSGPGMIGVIYNDYENPTLIKRLKLRFSSIAQTIDVSGSLFSGLFPHETVQHALQGVKMNLARLESLDGDQTVPRDIPVPQRDVSSALGRAFDQIFGGDLEVVGKIDDTLFCVPKKKDDKIGEHPNYVGKIVFIEIPLESDDGDGESAEYIVVQQSEDSLYCVRTTCCKAGLEVVRIPFGFEDLHIDILDVYEDDEFVREFIDRLDDMDTEDYQPIECDLAETSSRQLSRMLEKKSAARKVGKVFFDAETDDFLDRFFDKSKTADCNADSGMGKSRMFAEVYGGRMPELKSPLAAGVYNDMPICSCCNNQD